MTKLLIAFFLGGLLSVWLMLSNMADRLDRIRAKIIANQCHLNDFVEAVDSGNDVMMKHKARQIAFVLSREIDRL